MDRMRSIFSVVSPALQDAGTILHVISASPVVAAGEAIGALGWGGNDTGALAAYGQQLAAGKTAANVSGAEITKAAGLPLTYVDRGLQTLPNVVQNHIEAGDNSILPHGWGDIQAGYDRSKNQGLGQSLGYLSRSGNLGQIAAGMTSPLAAVGAVIGHFSADGTEGTTVAGRADINENDAWFHVISGTQDFTKSLFLDPTNIAFLGGNKIIKANRLAIAGSQRAELTAKIETGVTVKLPSKTRQATTKLFTGTVAPGRMGQAMDDFFAGTEDFRNQTMKKLGVTDLESKTTRTIVPPIETPGTHVQPSLFPEHDPQGTIQTLAEKTDASLLRPSDFLAAFPELMATADPMAAANAFVSVGRVASPALRRQGVDTLVQLLYGDNGALDRLAAVRDPEFMRAANVMDRSISTVNEKELLAQFGPNDAMNKALAANRLEWVKEIHGDTAITTIQEDLDRLAQVGVRSLRHMPKYSPGAVAKLGKMPGRYIGPSIDDVAASMPLERLLQDSAEEAGVTVHGAIETRLSALQKAANTVSRAADAARPSRTINAVTGALNTRLPQSMVDLVELDAGEREIVSQLQFAGARPDVVRHYSNAFVGAQTSGPRKAVAEEVETVAVRMLAHRAGVSRSAADQMVRDLKQERAAATGGDGATSAAVNEETGKAVGTVPLVQQPNSFNAVNFVQLQKALKREGRHIQAGEDWIAQAQRAFGPKADGLYDVADNVLHHITKFSKFSMLFRAGYAVRNLVDNDLRTYSQLGAKIATTVLIDRMGVVGSSLLRRNSAKAVLSRALKARTEATTIEGMIAAGGAPAGAAERLAELNDQIDRGIEGFTKQVGQARKGPTVGVNTLPAA